MKNNICTIYANMFLFFFLPVSDRYILKGLWSYERLG